MNMTLTPLRKAKGVVLVLVALSLVVLMGMAGLAIDLSHAEVNKTRLQNLVDALALSAATSLSKGESSSTITDIEAYARYYAVTYTLQGFKDSAGNLEVSTADGDLTFSFATDYSSNFDDWKTDPTAITDAKFVRVAITNPMSIPTWFGKVIGFDNMQVAASAVAGIIPIVPCNDILPVLACAADNPILGKDKVCSDGSCFGYQTNTTFCFKTSDATGSTPECPAIPSAYTGLISGNFGWMDVGPGGHAVNDCAAGDPDCTMSFCQKFASGGEISSQTGNISAIEQGFNTRFDDYKGAYKAPGDPTKPTVYFPDIIVGGKNTPITSSVPANNTRSDGATLTPPSTNTPVPIQAISSSGLMATNLHINYKTIINSSATGDHDADPGHLPKGGRRIAAVPFIDCNAVEIKNGGKFTVTAASVRGWACLFLTQPMAGGGDGNIYAEVTDIDNCDAVGIPTAKFDTDLYKVILYKDPFSSHS